MWISKNAYDGVEIAVRLAAYNGEKPCTALTLARWISGSVARTETLLAALRDAGLVRVSDGPETGYHLNRPANQITLAEILGAFDDPHSLLDRPLNAITLEPEGIDTLHGPDLLWEALKSCILLFLSNFSLADIAPETEFRFVDDRVADAAFWHDAPSTANH